jgi:FtsH-binding integral membrane protein
MPNKNSSFLNTVKSVAAAFFGVQSNKNRERDFSQGKLSHFIIVGVIGVIIFIAVLSTIVTLVIPST